MKFASLVLALVLTVPAAAMAEQAPPQKKAPACAAPEHHQFDFWVGKWDVYPKSKPGKKVAESLIESLYDGCGIRENWMPLKGGKGGSLNAYDPIKKQWRQFWTDASGSSALFTGGWNGQAMVIEGVWPQPGHPGQITRITYTARKDGSVEQAGQSSDDGGKSWQKSFDLIYRKHAM